MRGRTGRHGRSSVDETRWRLPSKSPASPRRRRRRFRGDRQPRGVHLTKIHARRRDRQGRYTKKKKARGRKRRKKRRNVSMIPSEVEWEEDRTRRDCEGRGERVRQEFKRRRTCVYVRGSILRNGRAVR